VVAEWVAQADQAQADRRADRAVVRVDQVAAPGAQAVRVADPVDPVVEAAGRVVARPVDQAEAADLQRKENGVHRCGAPRFSLAVALRCSDDSRLCQSLPAFQLLRVHDRREIAEMRRQ
jgi:hypothetical protein